MDQLKSETHWRDSFALFALVAICVLFLKLWLASLGHNYDMESWEIAAKLVREGLGPYYHNDRYPYAPLGAYILGGLQVLADHFPFTSGRENYHIWVALFLSLADLFMAILLRRMNYPLVALLFLLNPVIWLITGFHSQLDQLPIIFGFIAVMFLPKKDSENLPWLTALFLGISLITKHTLLFLPLWLGFWFYSQGRKKYSSAILITILPVIIFLSSFSPWLLDSDTRLMIKSAVFKYNSDYLFSFLPKLLGFVHITQWLETWFAWVPVFSGYKVIWLLGQLGFGWRFRKCEPLELLLLNVLVLLAFSPSMADQYLVIPAIACAFYWRSAYLNLFVLASVIFLLFYSPANVGTLPAMKGMVDALSFIPLRRYLALAFFFPFLWQYKAGFSAQKFKLSFSNRPL